MSNNNSQYQNSSANRRITMKRIITFFTFLIIIALLSTTTFLVVKGSYINDYWTQRAQFISNEHDMQIGSEVQLTPKEQLVDKYLATIKQKEFLDGVKNQTVFLPSQNFLEVQHLVQQSQVFKFLQIMPKGALLHTHDSAMVSEDFVFNLTFMDNLYFCNNSDGLIRFYFAKKPPSEMPVTVRFPRKSGQVCEWKLLQEERSQHPNVTELDEYIRSKLTLRVKDPKNVYLNGDIAWAKFRDIFETVVPLISFKPVLEKYWYQAFLEYLEDNVMYMEIRGTLPPAYDLDGKVCIPESHLTSNSTSLFHGLHFLRYLLQRPRAKRITPPLLSLI